MPPPKRRPLHARRVLSPRPAPPGMLAANHPAHLVYQPLGVIGLIVPLNYPVYTPFGSNGYAPAAVLAPAALPRRPLGSSGRHSSRAGAPRRLPPPAPTPASSRRARSADPARAPAH